MIAQRAIYWHRSRFGRARERFVLWLAWHLPRWLVTACYIRVVVHGTTGAEFGGTVPNHLDVMTAWQRWDGVQR